MTPAERNGFSEWIHALKACGDRGSANYRGDFTWDAVDIGQGYMMDHIQTLNAASLWDKFTGAVPPEKTR